MADTPNRVATAHVATAAPRITVHVPCYNYGRFLRDALDSLLRQSLTAWEAVVIDDASTDETPVVLSGYQDPRIRVVRHAVRRGHIETYNEGISLATGELFVILSADDRYKPDFLARVVACFEEHPEVTLVTTDGDGIDGDGRVIWTEVAPFERSGVHDGLLLLFERNFVAASAGVARTAALRAVHGYDSRLPHSADAYLWRQLAISGPVGYVHERLYERRIHGKSMLATARFLQVLEEQPRQLDWIFSAPDLPPRVWAMRDHAFAELHWKMARAYYAERRLGRSLAHAVSAIRFDSGVLSRHNPARALLREIRRAVGRAHGTSFNRQAARSPLGSSVFAHETACCESVDVGAGTKIWAFAHVMAGASLGVDCKVGDHVFVETGAVIGDRVTLKNGTLVWDGVVIENDVFVGPDVVFTNDLVPRAYITKRRDEFLPTRVGDGASIGANVTIVCGITVGPHAMVGAGSVVTKDVTAHALVHGNPATQVGWVCDCGLSLGPDLRCVCGRHYRSMDGADRIERVGC
jgi:UDP-2-acetamido-3-amino-2,3-dideoxy-glucuronate N-acetyltransferase